MHNIVIDKPYEFVPPDYGTFWGRVLGRFLLPHYLRSSHGVESYELVGVERLRASVAAGHGILLTPNHCRPCDPMVLYPLGLAVGRPIHIMASWHLFMQSRFQRWILRRVGVFSVYREGMDRDALKCAIQILVDARRPLVLFPEGVISRSNDRLNHLMDGTIFIARNAAKKRAGQSSGKVVLHPVAIRYFFLGDVERALEPVLEAIERRLSWRPQSDLTMTDRIVKVGEALLTLKELEYREKPQEGEIPARVARLMDHILVPLEREWLKGTREDGILARVKALRAAILPDMVAENVDEAERSRRWRHLADIYLAQQLSNYPPDYFKPEPTAEKLLETVERFEEDLTDTARVHRPIHAVIEVGEAIEVPPGRDRGAEGDSLMTHVRQRIETMLEDLRQRRPPRVTAA
ncbi:MAG: phospholipid/glycerol acyltransferase [Acidobacteria bacterium]|nr:phospholipid/glycerol acyltransferase [Acidobacteriota bacterium]